MKPRSLLKTTTPGTGCRVCRVVRPFLIVAAGLIAMLWSQPDWRLPEGYDYSTLIGDVFLAAFVLYLGWRIYDHRKQQGQDDGASRFDVPVRRSRRRNRVAGDPRGWK